MPSEVEFSDFAAGEVCLITNEVRSLRRTKALDHLLNIWRCKDVEKANLVTCHFRIANADPRPPDNHQARQMSCSKLPVSVLYPRVW